MRRLAFALLGFAALAGVVFIGSGCQRDNVLRVTEINGNAPIFADLADWGVYNDPTVPDSEEDLELTYIVESDLATIELQYVEIGSGLPTWTPYQALVHKGVIKFKSQSGNSYPEVTMPMNIAVVADREGRRTVNATAELVPGWWKEQNFGDDIEEPPDYGTVEVLEATLTLTAMDSISGREVIAQGKYQIVVGNFYDDPEAFGN